MKQFSSFWIAPALWLSGLVSVAQITPYPWSPIGPKGDLPSATEKIGVNGRIRAIEIRDLGGGDFYTYAGASSGGLWRSRGSMGPSVWTALGNTLPNPSVGALAVSPSNPDDILVGTGDWRRYAGAGMFHTIDGGLTWTKILLSPAPGFFFRILYYPSIPSIVLAATDKGLFRTDHGPDDPLNGWTLVLSGTVTDLAIDPSNATIQYACVKAGGLPGGGVFKSTDSGNTWVLKTDGYAPANQVGRGSISICRDFPTNVVFLYETNCLMADVLKSSDGGITWSSIVGNLFTLPNAGPNNNQNCHAQAIAFRPNNPSEVFLAGADFYHTSDGGQNWIGYDHPIDAHQDYNQLYFSGVTGDNGLWECNDGGIYYYGLLNNTVSSLNGNNQTGLQVSQISDMDATHNIRVIGNQDDQTAATTDGGQNWISFDCCDVYSVAITYDLPFLSSYWYIRSSGGASGSVYNQIIGSNGQDVSDPSPLARLFYHRFEDKVYSLKAMSVLVSRPANASSPGTWTSEANLLTGLSNPGLTGDRLNGQTLFVWDFGNGAQNGILSVYKKNGGIWSPARNAPIGSNTTSTNRVVQVFASTERVGESWAVMNGSPRILHTMDEWQTWADVSGNLDMVRSGASVNDLVVMPFNPQVVFAATDKGVFFTQNGGGSWEDFQTGLPQVKCTRLRYVTDADLGGNDKLIVATYGHGMYERRIPRPPLVYVDQRNTGYQNGTFEHPFNTLNQGFSTTPPGSMMALNGMTTYIAPAQLTQPMTVTAYEAAARLTR
jgi:photosystem II stability/assembly factor-like uncharacterized protein